MRWYRLLCYKIFHFDEWHISKEKPYSVWLANKINSMNINGKIVEIGCGLGDILAGIRNQNKIGYDIEKRVIWAAKFVHPFLKTKVGSFDDIIGQRISLLIAVNFLFILDDNAFKHCFDKIIALNEIDRIVIDEVPCPPYTYAHNFEGYFNNKGYVLEYRSKGFRATGGERFICFFRKKPVLM